MASDTYSPLAVDQEFHYPDAAGSLRDADGLLDITRRFVRSARARGALVDLPVALGLRAVADWLIGSMADAKDRRTEMRP